VAVVGAGVAVAAGSPTIALSALFEAARGGASGVLKLSNRASATTVMAEALRARLGIMARDSGSIEEAFLVDAA
jgi:hypothetical protein